MISARWWGMESAILTVIAVLSFTVWRFVFTALRRRIPAGAIAGPRGENGNLALQGRRLWGLPSVELILESGWEAGFNRAGIAQAESRADMYLHRVIALTGATQEGNSYFLDVGTIRFEVGDRFIKRLRDSSDPKGKYEETCFYSTLRGVPRAELIAAALLQLRNNPGLFEKWAEKDRAFKADGQPFRHAQ
jgi:hypothetical protein